jgi:hypothetical protein
MNEDESTEVEAPAGIESAGGGVTYMSDAEIYEFINRCNENGLSYHIFESLPAVLGAIKSRSMIADVDGDEVEITERIADASFRFFTKDFPSLSFETSEALASAVEIGMEYGKREERLLNDEAKEKSIEVRKAKADSFALEMKQQIDQLKSEANVSTYRDIVSLLNERKIPTSQEGGKWHLRTLQSVLKRAENLENSR